jgi:hypothetical protein
MDNNLRLVRLITFVNTWTLAPPTGAHIGSKEGTQGLLARPETVKFSSYGQAGCGIHITRLSSIAKMEVVWPSA